MNHFKYLATFLFSCCISFQSCDVIEEPFTEEIVVGGCAEKCKKILLEDYTGHKCGNCPRAAEKAEELKAIYDDQLVSIAVHAGFFASTFQEISQPTSLLMQGMSGILFLETVPLEIQMV